MISEDIINFFRFTKKKIYIFIGLFIFSILIAFLSVEAHMSYLYPLSRYLFNWADLLGDRGGLTVITMMALQMYLYSCIIVSIMSGGRLFIPDKKKFLIAAGIFMLMVLLMGLTTAMSKRGCYDAQMLCSKEGSGISGTRYDDGSMSPEDREIYTIKAISVPLTCQQACTRSEYNKILTTEIIKEIVTWIILPLALSYALACILISMKDNLGGIKELIIKEKKLLILLLAVILLVILAYSAYLMEMRVSSNSLGIAISEIRANPDDGMNICDAMEYKGYFSECIKVYVDMQFSKIDAKYHSENLTMELFEMANNEKKLLLDEVCITPKNTKDKYEWCRSLYDYILG